MNDVAKYPFDGKLEIEGVTLRKGDLRAVVTKDTVKLSKVGPRGGEASTATFHRTDVADVIEILSIAQKHVGELEANSEAPS